MVKKDVQQSDVQGKATAGENEPQYYKVTMKSLFVAHNEVFRPGITYRVSPAIYNGTIQDMGAFKDLCATAEPEYPRQ